MGRTLLPFRPALEQEISSWKRYKHGLGSKEQKFFDILVQYARQHADAGSLAARPLLSEVILLSIALEQQKCIVALEARLHDLEKTHLMKKGAHFP